MRFGAGAEVKFQKTRLWKAMKIIRRVLFCLILIAFLFLFLQCGVYRVAENNDSMIPEFPPNAQVIYDRFFKFHEGGIPSLSPRYGGVNRTRVIVFVKKFADFTYYGISRVVAVPGDTITFGDGYILVNDNTYYEVEHNNEQETVRVPDGCYFVLNDNPGSAVQDSRHFGYVRLEEIEGVVVFSIGDVIRSFGGR